MREHVSACYVLCSEVHGDTRTLDCRVRARKVCRCQASAPPVCRMQCGGGRCACVRVPWPSPAFEELPKLNAIYSPAPPSSASGEP